MTENKPKKLAAIFFKNESGAEPVRDWLKELPKIDRQEIGIDIQTVQYGWPLGMPLVENLGKGIWEVRTKLKSQRIARVLFFMDQDAMILVNGFIKKTQKTPDDEKALALKRKQLYQKAQKKVKG